MSEHRNFYLISKIIFISALIAALVYYFHPGVGTFSLVINGEPVADPLIRLAAFPTFLFTLLFAAVLIFVAFLGIGLFTLFLVFVLVMLGVVLVAPYFWPVLAMIFVLILSMSFAIIQSLPFVTRARKPSVHRYNRAALYFSVVHLSGC